MVGIFVFGRYFDRSKFGFRYPSFDLSCPVLRFEAIYAALRPPNINAISAIDLHLYYVNPVILPYYIYYSNTYNSDTYNIYVVLVLRKQCVCSAKLAHVSYVVYPIFILWCKTFA